MVFEYVFMFQHGPHYFHSSLSPNANILPRSSLIQPKLFFFIFRRSRFRRNRFLRNTHGGTLCLNHSHWNMFRAAHLLFLGALLCLLMCTQAQTITSTSLVTARLYSSQCTGGGVLTLRFDMCCPCVYWVFNGEYSGANATITGTSAILYNEV